MSNLSSRYLFHYKKDINVINQILKNGFRYNLWDEDLPYSNVGQQNFIICFCDIRIEESDQHRIHYGQNALVFKKSWAIKKGISPVRYIHKESPGTFTNYLTNKHLYRNASKHGRADWNETFYNNLIYAILKYRDHTLSLSNPLDIYKTELHSHEFLKVEREVLTFYKDLPNDSFKEKFLYYIQCLVRNIAELHSELELRDAFTRSYEEKDRVIYDEREWRSYKMIYTEEILKNNLLFSKAESNGYLPVSYNLIFSDEDLVAVLVENEINKTIIADFLKSGLCLVDPNLTLKKIYLTSEFTETTCT